MPRTSRGGPRRRKKFIAHMPSEEACLNDKAKAELRLKILDAEVVAIVREMHRANNKYEDFDERYRILCQKRQRARSLFGVGDYDRVIDDTADRVNK